MYDIAYLPAYSPDLNPIEQVWSVQKESQELCFK
ncbi:transposase [Acinetobacter guillouiae]